MGKKIIYCGFIILLLLVLGGCKDRSEETTVNSEDIQSDDGNVEADRTRCAAECPTDYVTEEMYTKATEYIEPDIVRLASVMKRAEAGESITVGVIGGSITQGTAATTPDKSYASIMKKWWENTFPNTQVNFVNAGIGGTDSYLGVHRMDDMLLNSEPDFVIVEFSVNDADTVFYKNTYDNLVRRILKQSNNPAVMLLFMTQENGTSAVSNHGLVGFSYRLPMLSYKNAVFNEIDAGRMTWKDISPDNIHPNDYGHAICGELIWKYLSSVYERLSEVQEEPSLFNLPAATKEVYQNATILDNEEINPTSSDGFENGCADWSVFEKGWSTDNGGSISFTVSASRIGVLYYRTTSPEYADAEVFVDGESVYNLRAFDRDTWGSYGVAEPVFSDTKTADHEVKIVVYGQENSACFDIFGILVN